MAAIVVAVVSNVRVDFERFESLLVTTAINSLPVFVFKKPLKMLVATGPSSRVGAKK